MLEKYFDSSLRPCGVTQATVWFEWLVVLWDGKTAWYSDSKTLAYRSCYNAEKIYLCSRSMFFLLGPTHLSLSVLYDYFLFVVTMIRLFFSLLITWLIKEPYPRSYYNFCKNSEKVHWIQFWTLMIWTLEYILNCNSW